MTELARASAADRPHFGHATVFRFDGDKITEIVEYLDTALIERVLTGQPTAPLTPAEPRVAPCAGRGDDDSLPVLVGDLPRGTRWNQSR